MKKAWHPPLPKDKRFRRVVEPDGEHPVCLVYGANTEIIRCWEHSSDVIKWAFAALCEKSWAKEAALAHRLPCRTKKQKIVSKKIVDEAYANQYAWRDWENQIANRSEILPNGTRVKTLSPKVEDKEWTFDIAKTRKWNIKGSITGNYKGHGLCYRVMHDDGTESFYDPQELRIIN